MITFQKLNRKVRQEHAKDAKNHCTFCDKLCVLCGAVKSFCTTKNTPNIDVCVCPRFSFVFVNKKCVKQSLIYLV